MIEKFSDEELDILRKELKELDSKNKDKPKPHYLYRGEFKKLFKDRPNSETVVEQAMRAISRITDFTLDCMEIRLNERRGQYLYWAVNRVPEDVSNEYFQMYGEIAALVKKHIKPYERFKKEVNDEHNTD